MTEKGSFSDKKHKKSTKDSENRRRLSSSAQWVDSSLYASQPSAASGVSRRGTHGHSRTGAEAGMQRRTHWETILDSSSSALPQSDATSPTTTPHGHQSHASSSLSEETSSNRKDSTSRSSHPTQPSSSSRAVPIAPRGPVTDPDEDDDGCRFKCQVEGCNQRFKHRSSRSRHKKNCHPPNPHASR